MTRQSGRTTNQMLEAPQGAIFVWCNGRLEYPKDLARFLGRNDLKIKSPDFFHHEWHGLQSPVILDHALFSAGFLTREQRRGLHECWEYLTRRGIEFQP